MAYDTNQGRRRWVGSARGRQKRFLTEKAATAWEHRIHAGVEKPDTIRFRDLVDAEGVYWPLGEVSKGSNTETRDREVLDGYLVPAFGDLLLSAITTGKLKDLQRTLRAKDLAGSYTNTIMNVMRRALRHAHDHGLLFGVPAFPKRAPEAKRWNTAADVDQLLADVERVLSVPFKSKERFLRTLAASNVLNLKRRGFSYGHAEKAWERFLDFRRLLVVATETGFAPTDLFSLDWSDVRRKEGVIRITRKKTRDDSDRETIVPLTDALLEALGEPRPAGLVFTQENGQPLTMDAIRHPWERARKLAGINRSFYDLRHYFGNRLARAGLGITDIKSLMGHGSVRTSERYVRADSTAVDRARKALSGRA
jgi:integrase